ncbi:RIMS2 [Lepeophtheirus salmonis]|uniref:RIMS2 n=1 Tax=Lepeophtheirus salmonis TaxID=72036 RepID=A0A7R8CNE5_LEPSM|nr:RIMS2 [Lepeophtheirus salmonis]CAF2874643.1 RIMS2 [Lepeophtheirus salmonis]
MKAILRHILKFGSMDKSASCSHSGSSSQITPDLSHLTPEEREIIENVMQRQHNEESKEIMFLRHKQEEIAHAKYVSKQNLRTESVIFCHYCSLRCCARCGGKVTLRSNKVIWVCLLCRKKQELLIKTGSWMKSSLPESFQNYPHLDDSDLLRRIKADIITSPPSSSSTSSKSVPPLPSSSAFLRKSISLSPAMPDPSIDNIISSNPPPHHFPYTPRQAPPFTHQRPFYPRFPRGQQLSRQRSLEGGFPSSASSSASSTAGGGMHHLPSSIIPSPTASISSNRGGTPRRLSEGEPPRLFRYPYQHRGGSRMPPPSYRMRHPPSSWGRESLSAPEDNIPRHHSRDLYPRVLVSEGESRDQCTPLFDPENGNDSLSSDQSECVRPPPPKPHKRKTHLHHPHSEKGLILLSSSEEELQSTPDCTTSCEEFESESISEKGELEIQGTERLLKEEILDAKIKKFFGIQENDSQDKNILSLGGEAKKRRKGYLHHPLLLSRGEEVKKKSKVFCIPGTHGQSAPPYLHRHRFITRSNSVPEQYDPYNNEWLIGNRGCSSSYPWEDDDHPSLSLDRTSHTINSASRPIGGHQYRQYSLSSELPTTSYGRQQNSYISSGSSSSRHHPSLVHQSRIESSSRGLSKYSFNPLPPSRPPLTLGRSLQLVTSGSFLASTASSSEQHRNIASGGGGGGGLATGIGAPTTTTQDVESGRWAHWDTIRQESQESATRDSGIETSSCFTSSEDSNRGDQFHFKKHPVSWQQDGPRLVGHMILQKNLKEGYGSSSTASLLGVKVVGGKLLPITNHYGAIVEKVKKGSVADTIGHLLPGDEVLEWNGHSLVGKTYEEVHDIISDSRHDSQVELRVSRSRPLPSDMGRSAVNNTSGGFVHARPANPYGRKYMERPSVTISDPLGDTHMLRSHSPSNLSQPSATRIQVKTWYDTDRVSLIVTVLSAVDLPPRVNGQYRNPYAKVYLLPDRSESSKRRTKTLGNTNNPNWNQSFVFTNIEAYELASRVLEVTIWDYDRFGANEFLGEVSVNGEDLVGGSSGDEGTWLPLSHHHPPFFSDQVGVLKRGMYLDTDHPSSSHHHISPPSTMSRLSDSEFSDLDEYGLPRGAGNIPGVTDLDRYPSRRYDADYIQSSNPQDHSRRQNFPHHKYQDPDDQSHYYSSSYYHSRSRSQEDERRVPQMPPSSTSLSHSHHHRGASRSATATPTGSPQKRRLPQIPSSTRERDFDDRPRMLKNRVRPPPNGPFGGGRRGGYSDTELVTMDRYEQDYDTQRGYYTGDDVLPPPPPPRGRGVPPPPPIQATGSGGSRRPSYSSGGRMMSETHQPTVEFAGDSDIESVISAFSSQSAPHSRGGRKTGVHGKANLDRIHLDRTLTERDDKADSFVLDGSLSDTAVSSLDALDRQKQVKDALRKGQSIGPDNMGQSGGNPSSSGLGKKSNSTSQLSAAGHKRRLGLLGAKRTTITVHRSEEILPSDIRSRDVTSGLVRQNTSVSSEGEDKDLDLDGAESWLTSSARLGSEGQLSEFIEGLGPGQLVGRQVLASPALGDIQISMCDRRGHLEVEVIRARGLQCKPGSKLPGFKVYLVCGKRCLAKAKTATARRTLDPLYQQQLVFHEKYHGCVFTVSLPPNGPSKKGSIHSLDSFG